MAIFIPRARRYRDPEALLGKRLRVRPSAENDYGLVYVGLFSDARDLLTGKEGTLVSAATTGAQGLKTTGVWGEAAASADRLDVDSQTIRERS